MDGRPGPEVVGVPGKAARTVLKEKAIHELCAVPLSPPLGEVGERAKGDAAGEARSKHGEASLRTVAGPGLSV